MDLQSELLASYLKLSFSTLKDAYLFQSFFGPLLCKFKFFEMVPVDVRLIYSNKVLWHLPYVIVSHLSTLVITTEDAMDLSGVRCREQFSMPTRWHLKCISR